MFKTIQTYRLSTDFDKIKDQKLVDEAVAKVDY